MDRLRRNFIMGQRYGFLCLVLFGLCLKAEALAGTWSAQTSPVPNNLFSVHFATPTDGWAVGINRTIIHTSNGGANWATQTPVGPVSSYLGVRFLDALTGWAGGGQAVIRTTDGGVTWQDTLADPLGTKSRSNLFATTSVTAWAANGNSAAPGTRFLSRYTAPTTEQDFDVVTTTTRFTDLFFVDADNGWAVGGTAGSVGVIRRITNGSTGAPGFADQTVPAPANTRRLNGIHMVSALVGYIVGDNGTILKTTDGATWVAQTSGTANVLRSVSCIDVDRCWAVGFGGIILRTINGGATAWTAETSPTTNELRRVFMLNADVGYAVGAVGTIIKYVGPTAVTLESFTASADDGGEVRLHWRTGYEVANLGFNVYREQGGKRTRLTEQILAGSALLAGPETGLTAGASYEWSDELQPGKGETRYWLEELDLNGQSIWHGPARIEARVAARKGERKKTVLLNSLGSGSRSSTTPAESKAKLQIARDSTGLANRAAVKLFIKEEGWYRVSQEELLAAGLDASVDPRRLQLFVDGREQNILVRGEDDGSFDPADRVEFYGIGLDSSYSDTRTYWLTEGFQRGQRLQQTEVEGMRVAGKSFQYRVERRDRTVYFSSLLNGEAENFFGAVVGKEAVDQSIDLPNLDAASPEQALIEISLQGVTGGEHRVKVSLNGDEVGSIVFEGKSQGRGSFLVSQRRLKEIDNQIRLLAQNSERDVSLIDAVRVTYWHRYSADHDLLRFDLSAEQEVVIGGFSSDEIRVMDVTDPDYLREVAGKIQRQGTDFAVRIAAPGRGVRTMFAFTESQIRRPSAILANRASSWLETKEGADLVIIAHGDFIDSVSPLRALRESQGLRVAVADVEDIYDEFSYGQKTPHAIRDFLQFAKTSWQKAPRFVLLVGDASLDPKNYKGKGNFDFVPTKLIETELLETASDDWFADFAGEGLPEMAIGRLPVATREEADHLVGKIVGFEESSSTGGALLVSDRNDDYDYKVASDELRELLPADMVVEEIVRDSAGDGSEKNKLLASLNRGKRIVNYLGHGSVGIWRGNLLNQADAEGLANSQDLALFVATTCLNGYFLEPGYDSLAEALIKAEGGAFAVWASSGMTGPVGQAGVNKELFRLLFKATGLDGRSLTLGEATTIAKAATENRDVRRTYVLFGDPTMKFNRQKERDLPRLQ